MNNIDLNDCKLVISDGVFTLKNINTTIGFVRFNENGEVEYIFVNPIFRKKGIATKLLKMVNQSYIGVNIDISLQNLSAKKITIVGAVETPGTYLVNPFSTITGALAYSGGISEIGSLRDIKLIKKKNT